MGTINHNGEKEYHEYFAKLILEGVFPNEYRDIELRDRPDLQIRKEYGIEVTRALFNNVKKAGGMFNLLKGKKLPDVPDKIIKKFDKIGYRPFIHDSTIIGFFSKNVIRYSLYEVEECFANKIQKIQQYEYYPGYALFIFSPAFFGFSIEDMRIFCAWCKQYQMQYDRTFQKIYVYDEAVLFVCDLCGNSVSEKRLDKDFVRDCYSNSYAYVNYCI